MTDIPKDIHEKSQVTPSEGGKTRGELGKFAVAMTVAAALHGDPVLGDTQAPLVQPGQTITQNLPDGRTISVSSSSDVRTVVVNGEVRVIRDGVVQSPETKIPENKTTSTNVVDRGTVDLRGKSGTPTPSLQTNSTTTPIATESGRPAQTRETQSEKSVTVVFNEKKDGVILTAKTGSKMEVSFKNMKALSLPEQTTLLRMFADDQKQAYYKYLQSLVTLTSVDPVNTHLASNGDSFSSFIKKYGEKALDEAIKKRDRGEWTMDDFHIFAKYQDTMQRNELKSIKEDTIKNQEELGKTVAQIIPSLLAEARAGNKIVVSERMKENIRDIATGNLPAKEEMRAYAQDLLQYMN
ncbi:hypothetical protein KBB25_02445 [Candidatus Gracilibacteria bacterium]|nr:hypothetical protein [Candidatus Gracilibacteria bacterium]